jgi:Tol biopolymer transport system component
MSTDRNLRERLDRAASELRFETDRRLADLHRSVPRRQRTRRILALAVAAVIGIASVLVVWRSLRLAGPRTPGGEPGPTGRIAYMRLTKPLDQRDASDLYAVDVASGEVTALHEGEGFSVWPHWSRDGSRLAYASSETEDGRIGVFVGPADGSDAADILAGTGDLTPGGPISLSWSPEGDRIAFVGGDAETGSPGLWTVNADGSGRRLVLEGTWFEVAWSPVADRLLVVGWPASDPDAPVDLYVVRTDGSDLRQLSHDAVVERAPSWSPDGARVLFAETTATTFENRDYGQDLFVMDADGSDRRQLTEWQGLDSFAVWSPDGAWIAFASDREATPEQQRGNASNRPFGGVSIFAMRPDGTGLLRLLEGGDVALLPSAWAP